MIDPRIKQFLDPRPLIESSYRRKLFSRVAIVSSRIIPEGAKAIVFKGRTFYCPVCQNHVSKFFAWGFHPNIWCHVCTSFDRHRFAWLFFERKTNLFDGQPRIMLHVAPEPAFERKFKQVSNLEYITADIMDPHVTVRMDVTNIDYASDTFDIIYCSHVLEHVPHPKRAVQEFQRVLRPNGWAAVAVPIHQRPTIGDPSVASPREREKLFGQHDHFWRFGPDFVDMLEEAGFVVEVVRAGDIASVDECRVMALSVNGSIFHCRKAGS